MLEHRMTINERDGGITNNFRTEKLFASHTSARRGGCLYAGFIILRDLSNGWNKTINSTMPPHTDMGAYLYSLHCAHNPALQG